LDLLANALSIFPMTISINSMLCVVDLKKRYAHTAQIQKEIE